jgi:DNA-binding MarR family transcriptional regulator
VSPEVVADRLHSAAIHLLRRVRKQDEFSGVGPAQLSALSVVVFGGPITLGALAGTEQVRPPTMSRIAAALVRARLVLRVPDETDARIVRLHATDKGQRLLQKARVRRISELTRRVEKLRPEDLKLLGEAAEMIERMVREQSEKE